MREEWKMGAHVWPLNRQALMPDMKFAIDWRELLPKKIGTRYQRRILLISCQELFLALSELGIRGGREYASSSLEERYELLRVLVRWMIRKSIWKFSRLSEESLVQFLCDRSGVSTGSANISRATLDGWISLFRRMLILGDGYKFPLKIDVDTILSEIDLRVPVRPNGRWHPLETNVAINLIREAIRWIDEHGEFLCELVREYWNLREKIGPGKGWARGRHVRKFFSEYSARDECIRLVGDIPRKIGGSRQIALGLSIVEGACAFLIFSLIGMRASEFLVLDHDCLVEEVAEDGGRLTYIRGISAKKNNSPRVWVADEPVMKVLRFWLDLTKVLRAGKRRCKALWISRPTGGSFFNPYYAQRRWSRSSMLGRIRIFLRLGCSKVQGCPVTIHPHQLRKTFAKLAVQRNKSNLEPVAAQLGHAYKSFTDAKYVGVDHQLAELLREEDRKELTHCLEQLLSGRKITGKAAPALSEMRSKMRAFRGKASLRSVVERLIDEGVVIAPCDWGFCVYARPYSACRGDDKGPNSIYRSPDVCATCKNFVVTAEHRAWWEARSIRDEEFLKRENLPEQTINIVSQRLRRTQEVLTKVVQGERTREPIKE